MIKYKCKLLIVRFLGIIYCFESPVCSVGYVSNVTRNVSLQSVCFVVVSFSHHRLLHHQDFSDVRKMLAATTYEIYAFSNTIFF